MNPAQATRSYPEVPDDPDTQKTSKAPDTPGAEAQTLEEVLEDVHEDVHARDADGEPAGEHGEGNRSETNRRDRVHIARLTGEAVDRVRRRIREQPLAAAGGAFLIGFAVGKGVPKVVARVGVALGLRMILQRFVDDAMRIPDDVGDV